jgi:PIN domain nuclease of toxin-antitoxin system
MPGSTTCSLPIIADPGNQIFVSAVSLWEIAIKRRGVGIFWAG